MKDKKKTMKIGLIIVFIAVLIYLINNINIYNKESLTDFFSTAREDRNFSVFFTVISTILVVFFVPISWLNALSAFFFGMKGFIFIAIAGVVGSIVSFYIARVFQEDVMKFIYKIYNKKKRKVTLDEVTEKIDKFGMGYVFFMRSMPFIPFSIANFTSGVTSIKFVDYLLGTILGLLPGQFITNLFFAKAVSIKEDPMGAIIAAGIKIGYVAIILLWQKKSKYRSKE
ncbi:MAG: TVP38/TMEM64 family membrane protein [Sporanaerobacter sp.]|jgi:uncharacterized membrane protein YdjX (TVP38/TMEM64 family)|uniref:TVP38/TMEM64 family protein n=1 Tax=Sporanaerobacter sp. TaxID=2010183 RepID=UPI003A103130